MSLSPLQVESVVLKNLLISDKLSSTEDIPSSRKGAKLEVSFNIDDSNVEQIHTFICVVMRFGEDFKPGVRKIKVEANIIFSLPEEMPSEQISIYNPKLCIANAFGLVRNIVSQATAFLPDGPLLLPLVNVNSFLKEEGHPAGSSDSEKEDRKKKQPQRKRAATKRKKKVASKKKE